MTKKRRPSLRGPGGSTASRVLILLEKIEQQNRAAIDAVYAESKRITDQFEHRFAKIELRLDALELAVRKNSEDIRKNSEDIVKLQQEVKRLAKILGADEEENAIQALDRRVRVLEERLGIIPPPA